MSATSRRTSALQGGEYVRCFKCKKELVEKKREDVGKWIWVTMICVNPNCTAHYSVGVKG